MATSIRLEQDVEKRLNFLATKTGRTKSYYLRELITRSMEDLEDYYLATDVLEKVRKGEEEVLSSAEVRRNLELTRHEGV
jgi:RHH-type rel operon transcriptional repressor/antitoxin RelB